MKLTLHTDYGLRMLMYLGAAEGRSSTTEIAKAFGVSQHHLLKVAGALSELGVVHATRGRGGGLRLSCDPGSINIGEVVAQLEDLAVVECLSEERNRCVLKSHCALERALGAATRAFVDHLRKYTLSDLVAEPKLIQLLQIRRPRPEVTA